MHRRREALLARLRRRHRDESGAIAILAAALTVALVLSASLAVDVGRVAATSRDQQGATDRASLDALVALRDTYGGGAVTVTEHNVVTTAVHQALAVNGFSEETRPEWAAPEVVIGHTPPGTNDFYSLYPDVNPSSPTEVPNAVKVGTRSFQPFVLALGDELGGRHVEKSAVAASDAVAAISATTTAVALDEGLLDLLLTWLLGENPVDLTVISANGVADAVVDLELLSAGLGAGSIEELLRTDVSVLEFWEEALAAIDVSAAEANGDTLGLGLDALGFSASDRDVLDDLDLVVGDFLRIETSGGPGARTGARLLDLLSASLQAANATGEENADCDESEGSANALDLGAVVGESGLTSLCVNIIEPPVLAVGPARQVDENQWMTVAETAQVSLDLGLDLQALTNVTGLETVLDPFVDAVVDAVGSLLGFTGDVLDCAVGWIWGADCDVGGDDPDLNLGEITVTVHAAQGSSALSAISCVGDGELETRNDVTIGGLTVSGSLFSSDDDELQVDTDESSFGLGTTPPEDPKNLEGEFPSEVKRVPEGGTSPNLSLEVSNLTGVGELDGATSALNELLDPVQNLLNSVLFDQGDLGLVNEVLDLLGISLGTMDIQGHDIDCDARRLLPLERSEG